jgi:hypothetical protein
MGVEGQGRSAEADGRSEVQVDGGGQAHRAGAGLRFPQFPRAAGLQGCPEGALGDAANHARAAFPISLSS